jgi:spermidine synthase
MRIPLAILGLTGVIGSVTLMRELMAVSGGNAQGAVAVLAAAWLWMAVGAWLAEHRGRDVPLGRRTAGTWSRPYAGMLVLVALFLPLQIAMVRFTPRDWLWGWGGVGVGALLSAPLNLMLGAQCALGRRLLEIEGDAPGRVSVYQSAGGGVGGLLFASLLAPFVEAMQIALLVAGLNLAAGWWMGSASGLSLTVRIASPVYAYMLIVGAVSLGALSLPIGAVIEDRTLIRQWPDLRAVDDSPQGRIAVVNADDASQVYWSGAVLYGAPDERSESVVRWVLAEYPHSRSLMLIGGGPVTLEAALMGSLEIISYAEPDGGLLGLWQEKLPAQVIDALANQRVIVTSADARAHLEGVSRRFDLIVVNLPGPLGDLLNRYYTGAFGALARQALSPGGVLVVRLTDLARERGAGCVAGVRAALAHQFSSVREVSEGVGDDQFLLVGALDTDPQVRREGTAQVMNQDVAPTCPPNEAWLTRPQIDSLAGWAAEYGWLAVPIGLLFLVGLVRRDLRGPLLPAFVNLAGGAVLATAMVGVQRVSGLLYAGSAELLMAYAVGIAAAGGGVSLLVGFLNRRLRLALAAAALLTQSLIAVVEPALISHLAGETVFPWAIFGLVAVAGSCVGAVLAIVGSQARSGAAFATASAGGALGVGLVGLLIIPGAGLTIAGQAIAALTLPGLVWLLGAKQGLVRI